MKRNGYTLIELLCVLGTLAILCTISVPVIKHADERSKERTDNALMRFAKGFDFRVSAVFVVL